MPLTQDKRLIAVTTPLGKDVLLLTGFEGREEMSRLFGYKLEMLSENTGITAPDLVGKRVTWMVHRGDRDPRYFNGVVSRFSAGSVDNRGLRTYKAEVVPWLWFLTHTTDCRIFQKKSVPEIIEKVFKDNGFKDYELNVRGTHPKWEYCVQYRETDFHFVSRLLEQEGIFYHFRHENGNHVMVLADEASAYKDLPESKVEYQSGTKLSDHIVGWERAYEFRPGKWAQTDYNFETPSTSLLAITPTVVSLPGNDKFEKFDYPGEYEIKDDGKRETKIRMEEEEVAYDVATGVSACTTFSTGGKFTLQKHPCPSEAGSYLITSIHHSATEPSYSTTPGSGKDYSNTFGCIPAAVTFRPARTTAKPTIKGPQTAVVVGPKGEEIYTDKYGRIKVQFHWDREGKKDENSSCWIRVAQMVAGKRWGGSFWPRIGQEVVVEFLEGDPDRPLITGVVYNAEQMPAYLGDGPDDKHKNDNKVGGIKSNTTKGGQGFNEWRFDDTKDKQQVFLHAERDLDFRVKNDRREWVRANRHLIVGTEKTKSDAGDRVELVWRDQHLNVKRHRSEHIAGNVEMLVKGDDGGDVDIVIDKNRKELIGKDSHLHVKGKRLEKTDKDQSLTVDGERKEKVGKDSHLEVSGNRNEKVGGNQSLKVEGNQDEKVGANHALEAGAMIHIKAGASLVLEAAAQLTLRVGGNFIDISAAAIAIQGTMVLINTGGVPAIGLGAHPTSPSSPTDPDDAKEAKPAEADEADDGKTGSKSAP
jgi:type VI secretion system secreted protein VgrG